MFQLLTPPLEQSMFQANSVPRTDPTCGARAAHRYNSLQRLYFLGSQKNTAGFAGNRRPGTRECAPAG
jgi:hypothetical protein